MPRDRNPECIHDREFREIMAILPAKSRVLQLVCEWIRAGSLSPEDLEWLTGIAAYKGYRARVGVKAVVEPDFIVRGTVDQVEAIGAYYLLEYLADYRYRRNKTGFVFQLTVCKHCERPFRLGRKTKEFCCDAHRAAFARQRPALEKEREQEKTL